MLLNMPVSKCNIRFRVNFHGFAVKSSLKVGETRSAIIDTRKENLRLKMCTCCAVHYGIIDSGLLRLDVRILLSPGIETGHNIETGYWNWLTLNTCVIIDTNY